MILEHDPAAVNDEDNDSQTALHLACIHGKYDVVELLLDKGADIEARDFNLWMPLDCAAAYGRPKCAKMLLEAGASVDPVDKVGFCSLSNRILHLKLRIPSIACENLFGHPTNDFDCRRIQPHSTWLQSTATSTSPCFLSGTAPR